MSRQILTDIDGVLNCDNQPYTLAWRLIKKLDWLARMSGAGLVITSAWRCHRSQASIVNMFKAAGYEGEILGFVPIIEGGTRGGEISAWLSVHPAESFVILDDDVDGLGDFLPQLVQTDYQVGLTGDDAERALQILVKSDPKPKEPVDTQEKPVLKKLGPQVMKGKPVLAKNQDG